MRDAGMLHPRHFFIPRHFFSPKMQSDWWTNCRRNVKCLWKCGSKWHLLPGTFYGNFESAWESADKNNFFCQNFFWISAWDSVDATSTSFPGTSYGKSAGENAEAKNTFSQVLFYKNIKQVPVISFCWQILPKWLNLRILSHCGEILWFTCFVALW